MANGVSRARRRSGSPLALLRVTQRADPARLRTVVPASRAAAREVADGLAGERGKQLAAYEELLRQYARFFVELKRAHADRRPKDYDWAEWSAALVSASLVAPSDVAVAIDGFGRAIDPFLALVAGNTVEHPLTEEEFARASLEPAKAQLTLVNAIRRSRGKDQGPLPVWIGGSLANPEGWP